MKDKDTKKWKVRYMKISCIEGMVAKETVYDFKFFEFREIAFSL